MPGIPLDVLYVLLQLPLCFLLWYGTRRAEARWGQRPVALAWGSTSWGVTVACSMEGARVPAVIWTVHAVLWTWVWWNSGGGDGTRRRLRQLASRFQPVRRTAPVTT